LGFSTGFGNNNTGGIDMDWKKVIKHLKEISSTPVSDGQTVYGIRNNTVTYEGIATALEQGIIIKEKEDG